MLMADSRGAWKPGLAAGYCLLLAVLLLAPTIERSQPVHTHDDAAGALFNSECPLAALAAFHGASPLPSAPSATGATHTSSVHAPCPGDGPSVEPVQHSDTRAPPTQPA